MTNPNTAPSADSDGGAIDDPFSQARLMRWGKALQAEGNSPGDALVAYADSWSQDWAEAVAPEAMPVTIFNALDEAAQTILGEETRNNVREWLRRAWHHNVCPAIEAAPPAPPAPLPGKRERALFQAWARDRHWNLSLRADGERYMSESTQEGWYAWKGRAALSAQAAPADQWKDAVLDELAKCCMDAPLNEPPASILKRVIDWNIQVATDPAVNGGLSLQPVAAPADYPPHLADEVERELALMIDRCPEPLRRLSDWLANKLDEDDWKTAERLLLGAVESVADRAQRSGVSADPLPLTDTYVQPVPDKCDRITWRGQYYHLPVSSQSQPLVEPTAAVPTRGFAYEAHQKNGLAWAVAQWNNCVKNRPLVNIHRRSFDDTWRQVIRYFGGDPDALVGPSHDALLAASPQHQVKKGELS